MIGIIGSGNVGANTAFFLAEKGVDHVRLYDIREGLAQGKALDMMEAAPIRGYRTTIEGSDSLDAVLECDIVIITAGVPIKPGISRDTLFLENRDMIIDFAGRITNPSTKAILVSEPVDMLTTLFAQTSSLPITQVMGLGGVLDATRLRYFIAQALGVSMENVAAQVVGRHTHEMIPLKEYCCVSGISIGQLMSEEKIQEIFEKTRSAGSLIIELARHSRAYYGPSAVAAELAEAIVRDSGRVMSVSHMLSGEYGIENAALSLPAVIGKNGISKAMAPRLSEQEEQTLKACARVITQTVKETEHE